MPSDDAGSTAVATGRGKLHVFPGRGPSARREAERAFLPAALEILDTPASPAGRFMMATIVVLIVAAVAWSYFGKLDIVAVANGRLIPAGQVKVVQPLDIGVVRRVATTEGAHVQAGDVLVELDPTTNEADQTRVVVDLARARVDVARLSAQLVDDPAAFTPPRDVSEDLLAAAARQLQTELAQHHAKLDGIERQIEAKAAERQLVMATIDKLDATMPLIRAKAEIYDKVAANQFASRVAVLDAKRALEEVRHDRIGAVFQARRADAELAGLLQQRRQTEEELRAQDLKDLAKARQVEAELTQDEIKTRQKTKLQTLRAPVDGTVEQVAVNTLGGIVTPAQALMTIVPDDARLEVEAVLANKDVGFVHPGQKAEIKIEAFSFTRYGVLHGSVRSIGRDAIRSRSPETSSKDPYAPSPLTPAQADAAQYEGAYRVRIVLDQTAIDTEQGAMPLGPGMAVTAEIRTSERRAIDYLLSPILRYQHDSLRER